MSGDGGLIRSATIAVLVENEAGVLARVIGLFSGRGYNIDSLTVAPIDEDRGRSRITVVTRGTELVIEQIKAQLNRIVPVAWPGLADRGCLPGQDRRYDHRELRLRVDGGDGQDRRLPGFDAAAGAGGDFPQWRGGHRARDEDDHLRG